MFNAMAKHNEDSPRYTPPVMDPAAVPVEIDVEESAKERPSSFIDLGVRACARMCVCPELPRQAYAHDTCMCMCTCAQLHDQRIAAELAIRTPATEHYNPRISGFAADLAAECAGNRRGFSPSPTRGIPAWLGRVGSF